MKIISNIFTVFAMCAIFIAPAFAASDNGCGDDDNDRISPTIALCSVHAYNIGSDTNPMDSAARQNMNQVIALKTTIQMQQLKRQYDYLETTIKRFKTQLEKAILVSKLEAAGATQSGTSSVSSSGASANRNVILSGAEDCRTKAASGFSAMYQCLQNNLNIIRMAVSAGNIGDANRQLQKELDAASLLKIADIEKCSGMTVVNRNTIIDCVDNFAVAIIVKQEEDNRRSRQNSAMSGTYGTGPD